ncbi:hypothetical protein KIN20_018024 [Parelaphostrongylus tenuis]|uniref:Structure-specific endonuclease subunit SLX1 C-terminal domain-containing protein n=1 Tax=Parelaphostrongylus tenuis TaxID=148309 RepID=A0AAD5MJC0_PARTN|nr:hypothetical protein KIN20_018024 [Parelaphostrongylus tenuis]
MNARPFNSFALTFRWLLPLEEQPFPEEVPLPLHVRKKYGLIEKSSCEVPSEKDGYVEKGCCRLCDKAIHKLSHLVRCPSILCGAHFHTSCLALDGLKGDRQMLYPVEGNCPRCFQSYLWGDIIRDQRMIVRIDEAQDNCPKGLVPKPQH